MTVSPSTPSATVVITGASSGIGAACALHLDKLGYAVFAGVRRVEDGARLQALASARLRPLIIDVTDQASIRAAAVTVAEAVGPAGLAGLVNNAGIVIVGPLELMPLDQLRYQFEVNVIGHVAVTQAFLPLLRQAKGRIINMSSVSGRLASPFNGPYAATKHALEALSDSLRGELRPWGIEVCLVEPGSIDTPIWRKAQTLGWALWAELPDEARMLYAEAVATFEAAGLKIAARGLRPEVVAEAVAEALAANRPQTRYLVGRDAVIQAAAARFIPDRLRDRLIRRELNQPDTTAAPLSPALLAGLAAGLALTGLWLNRSRKPKQR
jgi:NAD(P)-dependent dehydrogenase (short-subunit alcohol dehydrogenase family)